MMLGRQRSNPQALVVLRLNWGRNQDLTPDERKKLRLLFAYAPAVKLAYTLREELTAIFELTLTKKQAKQRLKKVVRQSPPQPINLFQQLPENAGQLAG